MTDGKEPVRFVVEDGVAHVTLDRPDAGNAIDIPMARALVDIANRCQGDAAIRCVMLTGAGRLFCAGGDIGAFRAAGDAIETMLLDLAGTLHVAVGRFARMAKPLVTVVNGPAAGAGLSLAIAGDVVLCGASAHFTAAYSAIGLTPDGGMSWLLPRLIGLRKAQEMILTNRRVQADEAERIGLVTRIVEDAELATEAKAIAGTLARAPVASLGTARALLRESFQTSLDAQLESEAIAISRAGASAEGREGVTAYFEKRRPDFRHA